MKRRISFSEVAMALDCQAKHDFAYVGALAGTALRPRAPHVRLREGRAWGRAVAALHGWDAHAPIRQRYARGLDALREALELDAQEQRSVGLYDHNAHADLELELAEILWHYASTTEPLAVTHPELELLVPVPSRASSRASSRYIFHGHIDGLHEDKWGFWVVEYKLRGRLTGSAHVALGRQPRLYAWAVEKLLGLPVAGVIVDERLNLVPKPPRMVKGRKKGEGPTPSHAKDQLTTADLYVQSCWAAGVEPSPETAEHLMARKWQTRERVLFSRSEIAEVDNELRSAGRLLALLDSGELYPLRNPSQFRCPGCAFREICAHPDDDDLVDVLFERVAAKRDREEIAA